MSRRLVVLAGLVPLTVATLAAQAVPSSQPKLLSITREIAKPNHGIAHEAVEARWADLNRRSGFPGAYFALVAASGVEETWWMSAYDTFDALGKASAWGGDNAAYQQSLAKIQAEDADHLTNLITMQARALPEASSGTFPEMSKVRVYSVMTVVMRSGYEDKFGEIAGHYKMIAGGNPNIAGWRAYEVVAGAPGGTYLVFTSFPSWAAVDANEAAWAGAMGGAGPHLEAAGKLAKEAVANTNVRYFTLNARMSLVPKEWAASDPFWKVAPAAVKKATP